MASPLATLKYLARPTRIWLVFPGLLLRQAHRCNLGMGIDSVRRHTQIHLRLASVEGVVRHHRRLPVRRVGEHLQAIDITHREDVLPGGFQILIDLDEAPLIRLHSGVLQLE